jgi:class 3 adenylate cyclase
MKLSSESEALFAALRQAVDPRVADALQRLVEEASDAELCRINAVELAASRQLNEEELVAALLHGARLGIFELSWNVLCVSCAGVLDEGASLRTLNQPSYHCAFCNVTYEPTLDEMIEVTFTVASRVRRIAAHDPTSLPFAEYMRQVFWGSVIDLPDQPSLEAALQEIVLDSIDLPAGERATMSLQLPSAGAVVFDPVTHSTQYIDVQGETTRERQSLSAILSRERVSSTTVQLRPGQLRVAIENRTHDRALPSVMLLGPELEGLLAKRRAFLTAKRLLSNQTFREIYRTDTLDLNQRLKITSLTFLFTDLKGSTELYERVGDLVAYELVLAHFRLVNQIVAAESGAVVKTIGDAVMATFPTPDRAMAAALRMRQAVRDLNQDLLLKIGIHEGPCLAVMLNERQDYFGQTVNIASRVQELADAPSIFVTGQVISNDGAARILQAKGLEPVARGHALRGIASQVSIYQIP